MQRFLLVCGAGALGCGARYLVNTAVGTRDFPYATLCVNLVGSFLIALVMELAMLHADFSPTFRITLTTGFIGGLTTYSAFNYETTKLVLDGHVARGIVNVAVTTVGCFLLGLAGLALARRLA